MATTSIFLATAGTDTLAFSSIGPAFQFIKDSHADLCAEGSTLMLDGVPATTKAVKARAFGWHFSVSGADAASVVAAAQSKLDGAIQACELVGIDPTNVAKVAELQTALDAAKVVAAEAGEDAPELSIRRVTLHKRGYKRS